MRAATRTTPTTAARVTTTASRISHSGTAPAAIRAGKAIGATGGSIETIRATTESGSAASTRLKVTRYAATPSRATGVAAVWASSLRDTSDPAAAYITA